MNRILDRLSLTKQFILIFLLALAIMASGTGMALLHSYNLYVSAKKKELQDILDTTRTITSYYVEQAQSGAMTAHDAQSKALAAISAIRYDGSNYIFVVGEDGTILSELNPALDGTNQMNLVDANGHPVFKPLIEAAIAGQPVYNSYAFPRADGGSPEPKIALAVEVPQWHWIIGTGVYITEVRTDMLNYVIGLAEIFVPLLAAYVALAIWVIGRQKDLLNGLAGTMRRLAGGALQSNIPGLQRADEIGDMARAVQVFKENAQEKLRLEAEAQAQAQSLENERKRNEAEREAAAEELAFVVHELASGLERLSGGDLMFRLTTAFSSSYEKLRQDFNAAMDKLHETMRAIAHNTRGVRSGAGEITQASDDLSRRTEHQAASLEQTAAALDQVTATIRKTAESANGARKTAETAKADAEHSGEVVRETVEAMNGIETSSKQIGNIIGVIDEIAFQTNLLALNAGVEAARAGDAGRGFAVVATEVRSLAQRSADAAKEIKALISTSGQQVETGVKLVGETGKALTRIAEHVAQLNGLVSDIAAAAQEQAAGLSEVNSAVNQMDQVTQQNAAMVEQTTAASHGLDAEARELAQLVGQFAIDGADQAPAPTSAPKRERVAELV